MEMFLLFMSRNRPKQWAEEEEEEEHTKQKKMEIEWKAFKEDMRRSKKLLYLEIRNMIFEAVQFKRFKPFSGKNGGPRENVIRAFVFCISVTLNLGSKSGLEMRYNMSNSIIL